MFSVLTPSEFNNTLAGCYSRQQTERNIKSIYTDVSNIYYRENISGGLDTRLNQPDILITC
jgi:hypothetical protein